MAKINPFQKIKNVNSANLYLKRRGKGGDAPSSQLPEFFVDNSKLNPYVFDDNLSSQYYWKD